ncbi:hypothetical protein DYB30_010869 [Aphanomyces astaci]|uniref:Uncharacterized protein n=1 Tax=Aphanomyces astaci TaxID=112090 RepID=A0A397CUZ7_APHAT|nr:hypothetical protein DYB30_010869 [Aphanomyces astaci]
MPSLRRRVRKLTFLASRALACVAAGIVFFCEYTGSDSNKRLLVGVSTPPTKTISYTSPLVTQLFLPILVSTPGLVRTAFETLDANKPQNQSFVGYLDKATTVTSSSSSWSAVFHSVTVTTTSCNSPSGIDYLYKPSYLHDVLKYALAAYPSWNLTNHWVVLDCGYEGRKFEDTTVLMLYLVDRQVQTFSTFMLQVLSIHRPAKQRRTSGGVAMFTTMALASMTVDGVTVKSSQPATYETAMGFLFPYEWEAFEPIALDSLVPPDGQWHARIIATNEAFVFSGTTGIYRRGPDIQASFNYFYWDLPSDPITFASTIQFQGVKVFKDTWGWFRCFLGVGIGFNIAINTGVAFLVMYNMYMFTGVFWVPDIYPSIQSRASIRALLLLLDCIMNGWWYPHQWAVNQGSVRNKWGGTLDFNEISRADGLMVVLATTFVAANALRVRVQLVTVVMIYALCYYLRQDLIKAMGVCVTRVTPFIKQNYFENILPTGHGAMDLWAYHENENTNFWLIANECTYLIVAIGASILYVVLFKLWDTRHKPMARQVLSTIRHLKWHHVKPLVMYLVHVGRSSLNARHGNCQIGVARELSPQIHWTKRSTLYIELNATDTENANVERCAGSIVGNIYGFVAFTKDYVYDGGQIFVSASGVWLLGFVIINDQYVVGINHYIKVALNALFGQTYFKVYGFALLEDVVSTRKTRLLAADIPVRHVWRVSLKRLR